MALQETEIDGKHAIVGEVAPGQFKAVFDNGDILFFTQDAEEDEAEKASVNKKLNIYIHGES